MDKRDIYDSKTIWNNWKDEHKNNKIEGLSDYNSKIIMEHSHQSDVVIINDQDALLNVDFFTKLVDKNIASGIILIDYPNMAQSTKIYLRNFTTLRRLPMLEFNNKNNSILIGDLNVV